MSKTDTTVPLDDAILASVDQIAGRLGVTREDMLEDSIRRGLAGRLLEGLSSRRSGIDSTLSGAEVTDFVTSEIAAARQERRSRR